MAEETTNDAEVTEPSPEEAAPAASSTTTVAEPSASGSTIALQRKAEGGLSFHFAFDIPSGPSLSVFPKWSHQHLINGALIAAVVLLVAFIAYRHFFGSSSDAVAAAPMEAADDVVTNVRPNVETAFNRTVDEPEIATGAYVDMNATVAGNVMLEDGVFIAPGASVRADVGTPIHIGSGSSVEDGAVVHALITFRKGRIVEENLIQVDGEKYAVYVGKDVTISHGAQVHGPALIGDNTHIGMNAVLLDVHVGHDVVIEPGAVVMSVVIGDKVVVPAGAVVVTQEQADALHEAPEEYHYGDLIERDVEVNADLAEAYGDSMGSSHATDDDPMTAAPAGSAH